MQKTARLSACRFFLENILITEKTEKQYLNLRCGTTFILSKNSALNSLLLFASASCYNSGTAF